MEWQITTRLQPAYRDEEEDAAEAGQAARFVFSDDVEGTVSNTLDISYEVNRLPQICIRSSRLRNRLCACSLEVTVSYPVLANHEL